MDTAGIEMILDECRVEIQRNMAAYDINASGRTSASFKVEKYEGGVRLVSRGDNIAPFASIENGNPPTWLSRNVLRQWVIEKGIDFNSEEERERFVWNLQQKIGWEGTERYRQPNNSITTPPITEAVEKLKEATKTMILKEITSVIHGN